ncbi:hypothetical protein Nepgr_016011 [Nepenthes gracilis]|uniref:Uncharacterized protein n=1 Tax=Nepenthes gracilis TaxID=150966 RepID=A0AAD3SNW2_NEPGR|nr:hypothetical protein Nepgr_016011 [Nepenthes gracilis]
MQEQAGGIGCEWPESQARFESSPSGILSAFGACVPGELRWRVGCLDGEEPGDEEQDSGKGHLSVESGSLDGERAYWKESGPPGSRKGRMESASKEEPLNGDQTSRMESEALGRKILSPKWRGWCARHHCWRCTRKRVHLFVFFPIDGSCYGNYLYSVIPSPLFLVSFGC